MFRGLDGFELLSKFRNRIVHSEKNFNVSGIELMEVWQISQWLCELLIFHIIGYQGKMYDRRRYSGFKGPAVSIPLGVGN